jgi:four helix bundle protein
MNDFTELLAYKKSFDLAMDIYEVTKSFPKEEQFSLTDQIRRCSRSVCAQFAEAYRKRSYQKHFISKMTDCDAENAETQVWLSFSFACQYINRETYKRLIEKNLEVGRLIGHMILNPQKYGVKI